MEYHIRESLRTGPVTKFSGLNVIRMLGEDRRLFFGENPRKVVITFLLVNVPATILNALVATVSTIKALINLLGFRDLEGKFQICPIGSGDLSIIDFECFDAFDWCNRTGHSACFFHLC